MGNKYDFATDKLKLEGENYERYMTMLRNWRKGAATTYALGRATGQCYREAINAGHNLPPFIEARKLHLQSFGDELPNVNDPSDKDTQDFSRGWSEGCLNR